MSKKYFVKFRVFSALVLLTLLLTSAGTAGLMQVFAQDGTPPPEVEEVNEWYTVETYTLEDGTPLERGIIHGPPSPPAEADLGLAVEPLQPEGIISSFPSYSWVFGCSAVSGAMIAGYYDRNGYPNMYSGPTNSGVMPLTDTSWPTWMDVNSDTYPNNPLIASHAGVDGRGATNKGSIDDYWVQYGSTANDPYIGNWTQHTWNNAIGDYMKTSQSAFPYSNTDGSTSFWNYNDNTKLTCTAMETADVGGYMVSDDDGNYGRKEFYEARGYTVTECWNQKTYNQVTGGFDLSDLQAEIDAGHPVLINVIGHTMVAYGYSGSTVYIRNTWDNNPSTTYTMVWDSTPSYSGMDLNSVSILKLAAVTVGVPTPVEPAGTYWTNDLTYKWTKVSGATEYQYRVWDGSTKMWDKTVSSSACGSTYCTHHPIALDLVDGTYKWTVRAKVGGIWSDWSSLKWYSIKAGWNMPFTSAAPNWQPTYGAWTWDVNSGHYNTDGLYDKFSTSRFDQVYSIYTYEVKFRRQGTSTSDTYGIMVNGNPWPLGSGKRWNKGYGFFINRAGSYSIWRYDGGVATSLLSWTPSAYIKSGWYNTLKVTYNRTTGFIQFFINGNLVNTGTFNTYKWGNVGITMYKSTFGWEIVKTDWAKLTISAPTSSAESEATGGFYIDEAAVPPTSGDDTGHYP